MQAHLPTEMSFLHNTRYYRLHLHYKPRNPPTLPHQPKLNQTLYPISERYTSLRFIIIKEKLFQD